MLRETSVAETAARHAMEDARTAEDAVPTPSQLAPSESSSSDDPVRYLAFLLDDVSRCLLLDWTRDLGGEDGGEHARGWIVHADHCTIAHSPTEAQLATFPWGLECEIRVLGVAGDARARAVHVELPDFIPQPASGGDAARHDRMRAERAARRRGGGVGGGDGVRRVLRCVLYTGPHTTPFAW